MGGMCRPKNPHFEYNIVVHVDALSITLESRAPSVGASVSTIREAADGIESAAAIGTQSYLKHTARPSLSCNQNSSQLSAAAALPPPMPTAPATFASMRRAGEATVLW